LTKQGRLAAVPDNPTSPSTTSTFRPETIEQTRSRAQRLRQEGTPASLKLAALFEELAAAKERREALEG
jgi:hypothetical protein